MEIDSEASTFKTFRSRHYATVEQNIKMAQSGNIKHLDVTFYPDLGSGTFGIVYQAYDTITKKTVAVKRIRCNGNRELIRAALAELNALKALPKHPNIVTTISDFDHDGSIWIVMDFCDLGDLENYLNHNSTLPRLKQVCIMHQTSTALAFLHAQKPPIFHRDIKLKNILIQSTDGGDVVSKLCDFGLAKILNDQSKSALYRPCQAMSTLAGSPPFMAPEFSFEDEGGLKYDSSVDVFALGLVFQQMMEPNRPDYQPLSVESRTRHVVVNIGLEMVDCYKNDKPLPTVIAIQDGDDVITKRTKRIINNMTRFKSTDRKHVAEVAEEMAEILEMLNLDQSQSNLQGNKSAGKQDVEEAHTDLGKHVSETDTGLASICDKTFVLEKKASDLFTSFLDLCLIDGHLYVCTRETTKVYDGNMLYLHTIPAQKDDFINSIDKLDDQQLVAASQKTLYVMNYNGDLREAVSRNCHAQVKVSDKAIWAIRYDTGDNPFRVVRYTREYDTWKRSVLYHLPVASQNVTLAIGAILIFATCAKDNVIYVLSKNDGALISKHHGYWNASGTAITLSPNVDGRDLGASKGNLPSGMGAIQADDSDALLISHYHSQNLYILHGDGSVGDIMIDPPLNRPYRGVNANGKLYMACYAGTSNDGKTQWRISMYKLAQ